MPGPIKSASDVPLALEVYRKTLSEAEDNSITISSIGMTMNLRDLINSKSD